MKGYPAYKETSVEWINKIPTNWNLAKVSTHVELINGYPFNSEFFNPNDDTPVVRIRDITSGKTETYFSGEYPKRDSWR